MDTIGLKEQNVKVKSITKPFLPDEIITNILLRLPARDAIRCELVCKGWRDLTSDHDFVDLHFRNSIPIIIVVGVTNSSGRLNLLALDKWWEPATTWLMLHRPPLYISEYPYPFASGAQFSHAGLIVLYETEIPFWGKKFIILNPARPSSEFVSITLSEDLWKSEIYGVYYHPSLKGYLSLWKIETRCAPWEKTNKIQYKILNFGPKPCLKTISNPFSNRFKMKDAIPILIDNYLYWKLECEILEHKDDDGRNDIMKFDIIKEEFMFIPCPVPLNTECKNNQTHLLNCDGVLSFLLILPSKITIWKSEGRAEQLWTSTEYTLNMEDIFHSYEEVDAIAVVDGKLSLHSNKTLYVCNLMEGTVRNYPRISAPLEISFVSHHMSLASLCNGKTALFVDVNDKVVVLTT